ncbi:MAG: hypothetical protein HND49_10285 [Planctomycetes bacterium]|nr:hypothetical protein [Planctomycetota bacterium]
MSLETQETSLRISHEVRYVFLCLLSKIERVTDITCETITPARVAEIVITVTLKSLLIVGYST